MANNFFEKAMALTEKIEVCTNELIDISDKIEQASNKIDIRKAYIMQAVADEIDDNGKPKFSNEASRKAEVTVRCQTDADVALTAICLSSQNKDRLRTTNEIEKYKNQLSIYKAFATVLEVS